MEKVRKINQVTTAVINETAREYFPNFSSGATVVSSGHLTENYFLEIDGNRFFLKHYRTDGRRSIDEIHTVIDFLTTNNIPVIKPINNLEGSSYTLVEGNYWAVFPYVEGQSRKPEETSDNAIISMAKMLADIHLLSSDGNSQVIPEGHGVWNKDVFLREAESLLQLLKGKDEWDDFDRLAYLSLGLKTSLARANVIVYGDLDLGPDHLTHGDYHGENLFFDKDDNVIHVFDLDMAEYRPRIYEVIRSMSISCLQGNFDREHIRRATLYLKTYHQKYPLPLSELNAGIINYFLGTVHSLWIESFHYRDGNTRSDEFLEPQLKDLQFFAGGIENLTTRLVEAIS